MTNPIQVLHVDDDPSFAELTATVLEKVDERISVETELGASDGIDRFANTDFDCIVSDFDMPEMSGIEFLEAIREEDPDLPFILYTGKGSEEIASEAISAGVTDYLQKESGVEQYTILANRILNAVEQRRTARERERMRERMELTLEQTDSILFEIDLETEAVVRHGSFEKFVDSPGTDAATVSAYLDHVVHPDDQTAVQEFYQEILDGERTGGTVDYRTNPEAGPVHWIEDVVSAEFEHSEFDSDGGIAVGVARNITEYKEREQELFRQKRAMDEAPAGITITDPTRDDNPTIYVNQEFQELTGYPEAEILGRNCRFLQGERTDPEPVKTLRTAIDAREEAVAELRNYRKDGTEFWNRISVSPVFDESGSIVNFVGFQQDITERKQLEREVQEEQNLLTGIVETTPVGIAVVDSSGDITFVNERATEIYGRSREELDEFSHDDTRWDLVDADGNRFTPGETPFERVVSREDAIYEQVVGLRRPSGDRVWVSVNGAPQYDEDGELERTVFTFKDITEQRNLEAELEEIFGRVTDAFYALDDQFRFTHVNDRAEELLQASESELLGEKLWEQYPEAADIDEVWDAFNTAMETQKPQSYDLYYDPLEFWVEATVYPSESGVSVYFRDITERHEYQQELEQQNEQLEQFASVVSHDLRNPLNVIGLRVELAQEDCNSDHLDGIEHAHERMDTLIEDLLVLAREGDAVTSHDRITLPQFVDQCWSNVLSTEATLEVETTRTILADRSRLKQLFENLFRNAIEHGGKDVTVTVGNLETGFYLADDGPGIPEADRNTVLDAGYTTTQDGTGFGLSIVERIVEAHDWEISVRDGVDGGARFEITDVAFVAD